MTTVNCGATCWPPSCSKSSVHPPLSYADVGGARGLVSEGVFPSADRLAELLTFLDRQSLPDEVSDGFYEDLIALGFTESQLQSVFDLGLVEYQVHVADDSTGQTDTVGVFTLTLLGQSACRERQ